MKAKAVQPGGHWSDEALALYSSGDLDSLSRFRAAGHLDRCEQCRRVVNQFQAVSSELRREAKAETLTAFEAIADWQRLEREMLGNVRVGLAASRCIENVRTHRPRNWRGAMVGAVLSGLFVAGWFANIPREQSDHLSGSIRRMMGLEVPQTTGTIVQSLPGGIAVRAQGATLTMLHPASAVVTIAGASSVGASYIDDESGEITIANVYGQ